MTHPLRVLVIEDDPTAAAGQNEYLRRIGGFEVAHTAATGANALQWLSHNQREGAAPVDVILLDMNLPDMHGVEIARQVRAASLWVDIIAVTAVRELEVVRAAIAFGVVQYIIKPYTFATFHDKLNHYQQFARQLTGEITVVGEQQRVLQSEIDGALASLRSSTPDLLPKGLSPDTLDAITAHLHRVNTAVSAGEITEALSISRITARRYLEYLTSTRQVSREPRYGTPGRPELEYRWLPPER
ncbi:response regulator [Klugiella xanthotipulae]|uniref:Transcriptional regulatory protein n=1 Tax=Klugiella xanthotipulae TaxID=244735 RepID=A0A543HT73_9MICO|nr:response regulator [Klugiella xanthotipulae]TQM61553.1 response regulator of citrate/malate metabolism [Klugiella xanthotipulae]